jgi:hypothetical protein
MGCDDVDNIHSRGCGIHHGLTMEDTRLVVVAGTSLHGGGREAPKEDLVDAHLNV